MNRMNGKTALVTGASSGVGRAVATAMAEMGIKVALVARREQELRHTADIIRKAGGTAICIPADLMRDGEVKRVVEEVREKLGAVSILVNNAARTGMSSLEKLSVKAWNNVLHLNLTVPFEFVHLLLSDMKRMDESFIFNISSEASYVPCAYTGAYGISKCGLNKLTEQIDIEYRNDNIHAVSICPGWINTELSLEPERSGISNEDVLQPSYIADIASWILNQPPQVRIGPVLKVTPLKQQASLTEGVKSFFELNQNLI